MTLSLFLPLLSIYLLPYSLASSARVAVFGLLLCRASARVAVFGLFLLTSSARVAAFGLFALQNHFLCPKKCRGSAERVRMPPKYGKHWLQCLPYLNFTK